MRKMKGSVSVCLLSQYLCKSARAGRKGTLELAIAALHCGEGSTLLLPCLAGYDQLRQGRLDGLFVSRTSQVVCPREHD